MKAVAIAAVFFVSAAIAHAGEIKAVDMKDMSPSGMAKDAGTSSGTNRHFMWLRGL